MSDSSSSKRRISDRNQKRKLFAEENPKEGKKFRSCDKAGCFEPEPSCCLLSCDICTESQYTSRWYHMSLGEHFCNNCFDNFYRSGKIGNSQFHSWSNEWGFVARASKPTIKRFVANELLPYWVKCTDLECGKWRNIRDSGILDLEFIRNFKCTTNDSELAACKVSEDIQVSRVMDPYWMKQLAEIPLLKNSAAGPYLKRFLPEDIGLCPTACSTHVFAENDHIQPFLVKQCGESLIWVKPYEMEADEHDFAAQAILAPSTYLGLRNLIVTVWNFSPGEWLTVEKINCFIICRGLVRIYLVSVAEEIIKFLTKKSIINYGIIQSPFVPVTNESLQVCVIGAGVSGLAAAKHLHNLGINVLVLEATSSCGGRICDNYVLHSDAVVVQGLINNPFTIMAIQAQKKIQSVEDKMMILTGNGEILPQSVKRKVDHELTGLIHGAIEWAEQNRKDANWFDTIISNYHELKRVAQSFSDIDIFKYFLNQYGIALKADTKNLTLLNWEFVISLIGEDGFIPGGFNSLITSLAKDLTIKYDSPVTKIDYSSDEVKITTPNQEFTASKVLITVPISVLQSDNIKFVPRLPEFKKAAIEGLGDFYCDILILEFPKKFWLKASKEPFSKFDVICKEQLFGTFIDITHKKKNSVPSLITLVLPNGQELFNNMEDEKVVEKCMSLLKNTFSDCCSVPEPLKWHLSHCYDKKYGGPYGTYLKVGVKQTTYDDMAKTVNDKVFFAGEATFRNIPSTVTGAYLSGLREAAKITKHFEV